MQRSNCLALRSSVQLVLFELRAAGAAIFVEDVSVGAVGDVSHGDGGVAPDDYLLT